MLITILMDFFEFEDDYPVYTEFNLSPKQIKKLNKLVRYDKLKFSDSKVHNTKTHSNETNTDIRQSQRAVVNHPDVFEWLEKNVIVILNGLHNKTNKFHLCKDELDVVKYETNNFFAPHQDFVKINCDHLKCATVLICLYADCQGGSTGLYFEDKTLAIKSTKTTGGCLMLRNEVWHSGEKLKFGIKIILKANLFITPYKINNKKVIQDQYTLVGFNNDIRTCFVPTNIMEKFSENIYTEGILNEVIIDMSYDMFQNIYECILNPEEKITASDETLEQMKKLGLVNKSFVAIEQILNKKKQDELTKINDLIDNKSYLYLTQDQDDYVQFKQHLKKFKNIIPVQFVCRDEKIIGINIYDSIPVFTASKGDLWFGDIFKKNCTDVNYIRRNMLFGNRTGNYNSDYDSDDDDDNDDSDDDSDDDSEKKTESVYPREKYAQPDIYSLNNSKFIQAYINYIADMITISYDTESAGYNQYNLKTKWEDHQGENLTDLNVYNISKRLENTLSSMDLYEIPPDEYEKIKPSVSKLHAGSYWCNESDYFTAQINIYAGFINTDVRAESESESS